MATLSDIIIYTDSPSNIITEIPEWQRVLWKYGVRDCQTLADYIHSDNPDFQNDKLKEVLYKALSLKFGIDQHDIPNPIHNFKIHENEEIRRIIERMNLITTGDKLPNFSLFAPDSKNEQIRNTNIADLKHLIGKITIFGKNGLDLLFRSYYDYRILTTLIKGIEFYETHLSRVATSIPNLASYEGNLFEENQKEKAEIVRDNLAKILEYLFDNGSEFIWGKIGSANRTVLERAVRLNRDYPYKTRFARVITNYTTLEELEGNFLEDGTLKRFVMTPKKPH